MVVKLGETLKAVLPIATILTHIDRTRDGFYKKNITGWLHEGISLIYSLISINLCTGAIHPYTEKDMATLVRKYDAINRGMIAEYKVFGPNGIADKNKDGKVSLVERADICE